MRLRPLRASDAAAVAAFFSAAHRADPAVSPISRARWRAFVGYPTNRGGRDFVVAVEARRVVGVLTSTLLEGRRHGRTRRHFRIVVHPEFRRRGIGSALLERAAGQPLPGPVPTLQAVCPATWTAGLSFLRRRGFRVAFRDLRLHRDPAPVLPPEPPPGFSLRPFGRRGDEAAWIRLHDAGLRGEFHFEPLNRAAIRALRRLPGFGARIVAGRGRPAGLVAFHRSGPAAGHVDTLLVGGRARGRGVGRALLRTALRALRAAGAATVTLDVEAANGPARALYASEGFRRETEVRTLWREGREARSRRGAT